MFNDSFNHYSERETISNEIRRLLTQKDEHEQLYHQDCYNYLEIWKQSLLRLSGNN